MELLEAVEDQDFRDTLDPIEEELGSSLSNTRVRRAQLAVKDAQDGRTRHGKRCEEEFDFANDLMTARRQNEKDLKYKLSRVLLNTLGGREMSFLELLKPRENLPMLWKHTQTFGYDTQSQTRRFIKLLSYIES